LSASDEDEKRLFNLNIKGEIATIGTCIGKTRKLDENFKIVLNKITANFSGYSQQYVNEVFQSESNIKWLPYEFQAIWSYELGLYYPSLFSNYSVDRSREALIQTLARVDMLHFAGSWNENNIFRESLHHGIANNLDSYLKLLPDFLEESLVIKSYGILPPPQKTNSTLSI